MVDLPVFDLDFMLKRCADKPYQDDIRQIAATLVGFLESNKLLRRRVRDGPDQLPATLRIVESDLTEIGKRLFRAQVIDRWLDAIDRSRNFNNMGVLEKGLQRVRKSG